jgi:hypothetical protein
MDRPEIKIVRFIDGTDVICRCYFDQINYTYQLQEPMMFEISNKGQLLLQHWLPLGLMKEKFVKVKDRDIMCIYDPTSNFAEHYFQVTEKMNSVLESNEEDITDMEQIMEAMEQLESNKIPIH